MAINAAPISNGGDFIATSFLVGRFVRGVHLNAPEPHVFEGCGADK
jgi:hypothetical protein